jgi:hypothetical protein
MGQTERERKIECRGLRERGRERDWVHGYVCARERKKGECGVCEKKEERERENERHLSGSECC